jgi:hypothetical protein
MLNLKEHEWLVRGLYLKIA